MLTTFIIFTILINSLGVVIALRKFRPIVLDWGKWVDAIKSKLR